MHVQSPPGPMTGGVGGGGVGVGVGDGAGVVGGTCGSSAMVILLRG